jgi:hypothetical protein
MNQLRCELSRFEIDFEVIRQPFYEVKDETLKEAGKVGLWTNADSVICLDDLRISVR